MVSSQVALHAKFGGVVPNLAKREHQRNLVPLLLSAFQKAGLLNSKIKNQKSKLQSKIQNVEKILEREPELLKRFKKYVLPLSKPKIDAIAVTYGPGLAPALWVGINFVKALAHWWNVPLIPMNHMEGHLFSAFLQKEEKNSKFKILNSKFPALTLLASGGHTELILMKGCGKYKIIGETLDDAAGEAFDKAARLLGLGYPGGPAIAALAAKIQNAKFKSQNYNSKFKIRFPRPMLNSKDYNFSFSGLKTAVLYFLRDHPSIAKSKTGRAAVAKEFQDAVVEVLVAKTIRAAKACKVKTILLGGGVAANRLLREKLQDAVRENLPHVSCFMPQASLTGDNALMIALAAYVSGKKKTPTAVGAEANLRLG